MGEAVRGLRNSWDIHALPSNTLNHHWNPDAGVIFDVEEEEGGGEDDEGDEALLSPGIYDDDDDADCDGECVLCLCVCV